MISRRAYLGASLLATGSVVSLLLSERNRSLQPAGSSRLGTLQFLGEGQLPLETALGAELDGRLFTNLSLICSADMITPAESFYIRTKVSHQLPSPERWRIQLGTKGLASIAIRRLRDRAKPMGMVLMECAGNARSASFGMISVAKWRGVSLLALLREVDMVRPPCRIRIVGFDTYDGASRSSIPGASWVFSFDELRLAGAFLATEMNAEPLNPDHGAPVRLVVPGWYGCCCIKWVTQIHLVEDAVEATSKMREYASRTHQTQAHNLAREYRPAYIDLAAMPVRVEKWRTPQRIRYLVSGIAWGGPHPIPNLQIRFPPEEEFADIRTISQPFSSSWGFWTHWWEPRSKGVYDIQLRAVDTTLLTRRLDTDYYTRSIEIEDL
jgi:DMSO/TMAO reductase YedYZ molybdopterin-dependent catalytic subunit